MAEQADAQDLKSCGTYTPVPVRFRSAAFMKGERNVENSVSLIYIMDFSLLSPLEFFVDPKNGDGGNNKPPAIDIDMPLVK